MSLPPTTPDQPADATAAAATPPSRSEQMRALFNRMAPRYDADGPGCFAHFGARLVDFAALQPDEVVLDIACGRGASLLPAAARVGESGAVTGIDVSDAMLSLTQQALDTARITTPVTLQSMDAQQLTFDASTFDVALCGFGLMFLDDLPGTLAGIRRVLRPGGRLALSTWRIPQTEDLYQVLFEQGIVADAQDPVVRLGESVLIERLLMQAGFESVRLQPEPADFTFASLDDYWATALGTGAARHLAPLDDATRAGVRAALRDRLQPDAAGRLHTRAEALFALGYAPVVPPDAGE